MIVLLLRTIEWSRCRIAPMPVIPGLPRNPDVRAVRELNGLALSIQTSGCRGKHGMTSGVLASRSSTAAAVRCKFAPKPVIPGLPRNPDVSAVRELNGLALSIQTSGYRGKHGMTSGVLASRSSTAAAVRYKFAPMPVIPGLPRNPDVSAVMELNGLARTIRTSGCRGKHGMMSRVLLDRISTAATVRCKFAPMPVIPGLPRNPDVSAVREINGLARTIRTSGCRGKHGMTRVIRTPGYRGKHGMTRVIRTSGYRGKHGMTSVVRTSGYRGEHGMTDGVLVGRMGSA